MGDTSIQWTDKTWNPVTGCTKVSQGCKHCYAETMANRMWATQYPPNADGSPRRFTDVRCHPDRLSQPLHWRKPARVFVNSMSDLFHEDVPDAFIGEVWSVMISAPQHTFQILTKRPERMQAVVTRLTAECERKGLRRADNVWLGVSVEDQANADERIPLLLQTPAAIHFLSCEPLLGPLDLEQHLKCESCLDRSVHWCVDPVIDWVIVGGESGKSARPFNINWARDIVTQCAWGHVACFIKQLGAAACLNHSYELKLRDSHGGDVAEWPDDLRVREFPTATGQT